MAHPAAITPDVTTPILSVLLATQACSEGVARHVLELANGLAERGDRVTVACANSGWDSQFAAFVATAPSRGIRVIPLDLQRTPSARDIRRTLHVRRLLDTAGPFDVVHGHSSVAGALTRIAALGRGVKRVYSPHALITMDPKLSRAQRTFAAATERGLSRASDVIVAVSQFELAYFRSLGLRPKRFATIPIGLDPKRPHDRPISRRMLGLDLTAPVIGFIGRLQGQKEPELAVRVLALLRTPAILVFVGAGDETRVRQTAAELGVLGRVHFMGRVPAEPLYRAFDVVLSTSRYESFGMSNVEALMAGVPVVATRTGVAPQVAEASALMHTFAYPEIREAAAKVDRVLQATPPCEDGATLRLEFSVIRMVQRHRELYRRLAFGEGVA